jgi:hypothetical protein
LIESPILVKNHQNHSLYVVEVFLEAEQVAVLPQLSQEQLQVIVCHSAGNAGLQGVHDPTLQNEPVGYAVSE